jgi:hypothetical protein
VQFVLRTSLPAVVTCDRRGIGLRLRSFNARHGLAILCPCRGCFDLWFFFFVKCLRGFLCTWLWIGFGGRRRDWGHAWFVQVYLAEDAQFGYFPWGWFGLFFLHLRNGEGFWCGSSRLRGFFAGRKQAWPWGRRSCSRGWGRWVFFQDRPCQFVCLLFDSNIFLELLFQDIQHLVADVSHWFFLYTGEALAMKGLYDGVKTNVKFFCYLNEFIRHAVFFLLI